MYTNNGGYVSTEQGRHELIEHNVIRRCLLILTLAALGSSCAANVGRYTPEPQLATGIVQKINISKPVKIINAQDLTEEHALRFGGIIVNYNEFTQSVVDALKMELERNGVVVNDTAEKILEVAVTEIDVYINGSNFRADILAKVTDGNGSVEWFDMTRASYASPFMKQNFPTKPLNACYTDLVMEIASNENILEYANQ